VTLIWIRDQNIDFYVKPLW